MIRYKDNKRGCNHFLHEDCEECTGDGKATEHFKAPKSLMFRPALYEHIGLDPMYIETPQQLYDACAERGLTSQYIADFGSTFKVDKGRARDKFLEREAKERASESRS